MRENIFKQINNIQLKWCFLDRVNDKGQYPSGKYEAVLSMTKEQAADFLTLPHSPKQQMKEVDGRMEIKLKAKPRQDGSNPVKILDRNQMVMPKEQIAKIGNGTVASVKVYSYETKFGNFIGLSAIKVNELKEYSSNSPSSSFDDDGYSAVAESITSEDSPF